MTTLTSFKKTGAERLVSPNREPDRIYAMRCCIPTASRPRDERLHARWFTLHFTYDYGLLSPVVKCAQLFLQLITFQALPKNYVKGKAFGFLAALQVLGKPLF